MKNFWSENRCFEGEFSEKPRKMCQSFECQSFGDDCMSFKMNARYGRYGKCAKFKNTQFPKNALSGFSDFLLIKLLIEFI